MSGCKIVSLKYAMNCVNLTMIEEYLKGGIPPSQPISFCTLSTCSDAKLKGIHVHTGRTNGGLSIGRRGDRGRYCCRLDCSTDESLPSSRWDSCHCCIHIPSLGFTACNALDSRSYSISGSVIDRGFSFYHARSRFGSSCLSGSLFGISNQINLCGAVFAFL